MSELSSRVEQILAATIAGVTSGVVPRSRVEYLLEQLNGYVQLLASAKDWIGVTTTPLYDGATTNPITVDGESVTAVAGDVTSYNSAEFIFNGTIWQEYGRTPKLGSITLSTTWSGQDPYTQTVTVTGITSMTSTARIAFEPTAAQLEDLIDDGVSAITVENNNGTLTAYSFGAVPSAEMTINCIVYEVE